MGDYTSGQIFVYQTTPAEAAHLIHFMDDNCLGPEWSGNAPMLEIKLGAVYGGSSVSVGMILNSDMPELPNTAYMMWVDPKYEFLGDLEIYVPGLGYYRSECDANGTPVIDSAEILQYINAHTSIEELSAAVERRMGKPWFDAIAAIKDQPESVTAVWEDDE